MCGRYMITSSFEAMARLFEAEPGELGPEGIRPNVSPTEQVPVVLSHDGARGIELMRWGFIPQWYKSPTAGPLLINARSEKIAERPAFKEAIRTSRCLLPANGFYEWQGEKGARVPWVIHPAQGGLIAMAGLWREWRGPNGIIASVAIITCPANATLRPIHERMPVLIEPEDHALWLGERGPGAAPLLRPAAEERLVAVEANPETKAILGRRG
ncbi:putative SOS response-associated peptidase YedK [Amaricoccus macauensis]|uniref:Abasic site processing protein n=1 Tax=Amaricoccus macauensis TaxID=57001 RepID=A0A840SX83_9RHOB|nr:SOS response-associated peptidase [Amaricoccus macauensis]MBB5223823.1 putative SOS response-associated peptidase YedK [Amaricoccus macauensis]